MLFYFSLSTLYKQYFVRFLLHFVSTVTACALFLHISDDLQCSEIFVACHSSAVVYYYNLAVATALLPAVQ